MVTYAANTFARERTVRGRRSDGFSKNFRPGPPRPAFPFRAKAAERKEGRSDAESNTREYVCKTRFFFPCRSPLAGQRSARTLGRAGRLIGRAKPFVNGDHIGKIKEAFCKTQTKTITLNGGSLGSWVDEERS